MPISNHETHSPKVSVIIPVYNGANYLREAIESALAQTYANVEVIVVNDGSTDGGATAAIAQTYGGRIRYFAKENRGVSSALNFGVTRAAGDYISWLSHDDVYVPNKLEIQVSLLKNKTYPVVLYGDYELIDSTSKPIGVYRNRRITQAAFLYTLFTSHPVNGCTTLIPKVCFDEVGLFDERFRVVQDYDMWFRLAKRFCFEHVPEILMRSRLHAEQGSRTMSARCMVEETEMYVKFLHEFSAHDIFGMWEEATASDATRFLNLTAISYLNLAIFFWQRNLNGVANEARRLAVQSLRGGKFLTRVHGYLSLMLTYLWFGRLTAWRW